jgi:hypothetical protein
MEKPKECDEFIYENIMLKCWNINPKLRPKFSQLKEKFEILLNKKDYLNIKQLIESKKNKKLISLSTLNLSIKGNQQDKSTSSVTDAIVELVDEKKISDLSNTDQSINSTTSLTTATPSYSFNKKRLILHPLDGNSLNNSVSIESSTSSSCSSSSSFDNINNYIERHKNKYNNNNNNNNDNDNEFDKEEEFLRKCLFDDNDYKNLINDIKYNYNSSSKNLNLNNPLVINSSSDIDISFKAIVENKTAINSSLFNKNSVYN